MIARHPSVGPTHQLRAASTVGRSQGRTRWVPKVASSGRVPPFVHGGIACRTGIALLFSKDTAACRAGMSASSSHYGTRTVRNVPFPFIRVLGRWAAQSRGKQATAGKAKTQPGFVCQPVERPGARVRKHTITIAPRLAPGSCFLATNYYDKFLHPACTVSLSVDTFRRPSESATWQGGNRGLVKISKGIGA
ncbi:hypothetical protein GQ53DRAFT_537272 [Thozetella sp. PMI_491]|nr:hypothetical protein GQ53DRAFT_537272 [Thozetella sp. PMI_491]